MKNRLLIGSSDKLALFLHFIQQDFPSGVTIIDPDGRLAEAALDIIPKRFTDDVCYFDPSDEVNVTSFNIFDGVKDTSRFVQDVVGVLDTLLPGGSETLTRLYSNTAFKAALTILLDNEGVSFRSVLKFLSDEQYQKRCLEHCTSAHAKEMWARTMTRDRKMREAAFALIETKVDDILLSPLLARTLDVGNGFYPTKTPILIANLDRAKIGDMEARVLGTLLFTRAKTPIYINDFGFLASDHLAAHFSKGGYTVGVQFLSTLPPNVAEILMGFPDTRVFRTTPREAESLKFAAEVDNIGRITGLDAGEFLPPLKLVPPEVTGRAPAVLKRSIACHTRKQHNLRGKRGMMLGDPAS